MLKTGDKVTMRWDDGWIGADVVMASPNGKSLMLQFDGIVADHVGMMPVLLCDDGVYRAVFNSCEVAFDD